MKFSWDFVVVLGLIFVAFLPAAVVARLFSNGFAGVLAGALVGMVAFVLLWVSFMRSLNATSAISL